MHATRISRDRRAVKQILIRHFDRSIADVDADADADADVSGARRKRCAHRRVARIAIGALVGRGVCIVRCTTMGAALGAFFIARIN